MKIGIADDSSREKLDRRVSVAPMMDWTDRHCRYFLRGFSPRVLLYTEMIVAAAILRGARARLLAFDPEEHPLALQLGGSDPAQLAAAARAGEAAGYDEINLNCGCPSDRVQSGEFGACLMREPLKVGECVAAMRSAVRISVTVKMRIGVVAGREPESSAQMRSFDARDQERLLEFVSAVRSAGCDALIVHARKAVLGGLSPKHNRAIPPLRYDVVQALKPHVGTTPLVLNGGLRSVESILDALQRFDGVMLGREAYHHPFLLAELHAALYAHERSGALAREVLLERMANYADRELARGERLPSITRHMLGLYAGQPGAREYRRLLSEGARGARAGSALLRSVASCTSESVARARRP